MKLKAFTLIELVVALAISSIVVGIVYSCYQIVGGYYARMKAENDHVYERHLFHALLNEDFDKSEWIGKEGEAALNFYFPGRQVQYDFDEEYIIRIADATTDTFHIVIESMDIHQLKGQLVDELALETTFLESTLPVHLKKTYAANLLMEVNDEH